MVAKVFSRSAGAEIADFSAVRGKRLLIALSGGADSVALAAMLADARQACALTLFAGHVDHGIRPESADDAEWCRALCRRLDIPFCAVRLDVPGEAARTGEGLETAARRLRHGWLNQRREALGADYIALAHHMDDQAETVLMHLGRGAGPDGVCGMRTFAGALYRPLLGLRKAALIDWLNRRGLTWREDSTNQLDDNPRNAIRLHGIPELEQCYPQFVPAVARFAQSAQIESDCLAALTGDYLRANSHVGPLYRWLDLSAAPHRALLRRAIRAMCPEALSWEQVNALEALCGAARGRLDVGGACVAERAGHRLYFVPKRLPAIPPVPLNPDGATRLSPLCRVTAAPCPPAPIRDDPMRQALNPAALRGAVLRTRRPGDRIRPLGCGDKLLSDYFIDKKVDRPLRDATPLVAVGNRVHWVCGHGISQEAALAPGDDAAVLLTCTEDTE